MSEADFFQGILSNAAWDLIKWVVFIAGGGLLARYLTKRRLSLKNLYNTVRINYFSTYREKFGGEILDSGDTILIFLD